LVNFLNCKTATMVNALIMLNHEVILLC
jgi:hypothetical protein